MGSYVPPPMGLRRGMTISDLILQRGDIAAQRAAQSGQIWGNALQNVGNIAAGAIMQHSQTKEEGAQTEALKGFLANLPEDPEEVLRGSVAILGPEGAKFARGVLDFRTAAQKEQQGEVPTFEEFESSAQTVAKMWKKAPDYVQENWGTVSQVLGRGSSKYLGTPLEPEWRDEYGQALEAFAEKPDLIRMTYRNKEGQEVTEMVPEEAGAMRISEPKPEPSLEERAEEARRLARARAEGTAAGSPRPAPGGGKVQYYLDRETGSHVQKTPEEVAADPDRYGRPLFAAPQQELEKVNRNLSAFGDIRAALDIVKDKVGPVTYTWNELKQRAPEAFVAAQPAFRAFQQQLNSLTNEEIKRITGAQMSEPEAKRLKKGMADGSLKLQDLYAALYIWERGMQRSKASLTGTLDTWQAENPYDPTFGAGGAAPGGGASAEDARSIKERLLGKYGGG